MFIALRPAAPFLRRRKKTSKHCATFQSKHLWLTLTTNRECKSCHIRTEGGSPDGDGYDWVEKWTKPWWQPLAEKKKPSLEQWSCHSDKHSRRFPPDSISPHECMSYTLTVHGLPPLLNSQRAVFQWRVTLTLVDTRRQTQADAPATPAWKTLRPQHPHSASRKLTNHKADVLRRLDQRPIKMHTGRVLSLSVCTIVWFQRGMG